MTQGAARNDGATGPLLVLVTGPPAAGKTTLSRHLARELRLPLLCRDDLKEILFDTLGWRDRAWSRQLGVASWNLLYHLIGVELAAGRSLIAESNFQRRFASCHIQRLCREHAARPLQVLCVADGDELARRYARRAASGERHAGHADTDEVWLAEATAALTRGPHLPLDVGGQVVTLDTTDFAVLDMAALVVRLRWELEVR
jgi:predicted kinase